MGYLHADRVKETSTTTGLGTYSLDGASAGFRTFVAGIGSGNRCTYAVDNGTDWEINEGVVTDAAPDTLTRARLLVSSTGAAIDWGAGTKTIQCVYSAADRNPRTRKLTADHAISSTVATEVTGLELTNVQPGLYTFKYYLIFQSATATVGIGTGINFTGTGSVNFRTASIDAGGLSTGTGTADDLSTGAGGMLSGNAGNGFTTTAPSPVSAAVATINVNTLMTLEGVLAVTAAGNLEFWHSSETASSTTIKANSCVVLTRIDD